ncbi:MAG TPA: beta-eliminating lyase-related protein [Actinophytocola sp.]|uniref:threonine aldolase family protein n=1 Tax=Actinophytocola sp. TaxID=1872138 RepID=UPI002DDCB692|nr:beta-eliminating lyase-related protein [Actinophytocola sp.]HEV2783509.1 beta-eliminating lyase-related protein [Actinophytocola sp.]
MPYDVGKRFLSAIAGRHPARVLPRLLDRVGMDEAEEDAVPRLEGRIAELLGKPAAAMFPSGTMAQQVAMRIHADRRGIRTVAWHPQCHLEVHERKGFAVVHGLTSVLVGNPFELIQLADLAEVREPVAALLLELPQREIGGRLPSWDDLVAQAGWARERGAAVHMDGARLWEAQPFYDRPHAEIAALFDTVYVSLYKGLAGISGAVLAGEPDLIGHARVWRDRLGGAVDRNWPMALTAERGLDELLPRMAEFAERARKVAAALARLPGAHVVPDPPQTPMFHLHLEAPPAAVREAVRQLREEAGLAPPTWVQTMPSPHLSGFEINVSEQLDEVTDTEIGDLFVELMDRARVAQSSAGGSTSPRMA